MQFLKRYKFAFLVFFQSIIITSGFITFSPAYLPVPHTDSGIFLYIGSQILKGKVLYLQNWDNKQPLVYFLNALGLWLGKGSPWGVWALELGLFILAFALLFYLLRKILPPVYGFFISLLSFLTIFQIMSGNYTEEYAITFQAGLMAIFFLGYLPDRHKYSRPISALIMGILSGAIFCLKQTYIDVTITIGIFLLFSAWVYKNKTILLDILWYFLGFAVVNLTFLIYFISHNAAQDYIVDAYLINKYYSSQVLLEWLHSLLQVVVFQNSYPLLFITDCLWLTFALIVLVKMVPWFKQIFLKQTSKWICLGIGIAGSLLFLFSQFFGKEPGIGLLQWLLIFFSALFLGLTAFLFFNKKKTQTKTEISLRQVANSINWSPSNPAIYIFLGLIDFPIVFAAISISGRNFPHYYITCLPCLFFFLTGSILWLNCISKEKKSSAYFINCLIIATMIMGCFTPLEVIISRISGRKGWQSQTVSYIDSVTKPEDKILVWGWESGIYFLANRESPTRYSFQFAAYLESPYQTKIRNTIKTEIEADPPLYIVDTVDGGMPFIQGQNKESCLKANPANGEPLQAILNYVCSNYEYVKSLENYNIYRRIQ